MSGIVVPFLQAIEAGEAETASMPCGVGAFAVSGRFLCIELLQWSIDARYLNLRRHGRMPIRL